jgi:hypothetical protein
MSYRQLLSNNRHPSWLAPVLSPLPSSGRLGGLRHAAKTRFTPTGIDVARSVFLG